ncbi:MAG: putative phosphatidylinositol-4-phosphate 5-kinase [Firmicutes bacterium]|nr:putative phosphatidylinositol-4-phosphate 5-kinase [Bacillota bacterium]
MYKANVLSRGFKTLILVVFLLAVAVPVYAEDLWLKDPATGFKVWDPSYLDNRTFTWTGGCKSGYVDGKGTLTVYYRGQASRQYEGTYVIGRLSGQGVLITYDGHDTSHYEGELRNGERHGKGVMVMQDGTRYEADWEYNNINGRATVIWPTGERLEGTFKMGLTGEGVKVWPNGDRYEGGFIVGARSSEGIMIFADGTRYKGNWQDDKCEGYGEISKDGRIIRRGWFFENQFVGTEEVYRDRQDQRDLEYDD